jgi:hypothetical protein
VRKQNPANRAIKVLKNTRSGYSIPPVSVVNNAMKELRKLLASMKKNK